MRRPEQTHKRNFHMVRVNITKTGRVSPPKRRACVNLYSGPSLLCSLVLFLFFIGRLALYQWPGGCLYVYYVCVCVCVCRSCC